MAALSAGDLDREIDLQQRTTTKGPLNATVEAWPTLYAGVPAKRIDASDGERVRAAQVGAVVTTRFQIRWEPEFAALDPANCRLVHEGRTYNIGGIKEMEGARRQFLEITASALVGAAP